jgi:hypothetical protein
MRWVAAYTATLPEEVGTERHSEVRADMHDQIRDGLARGLPRSSISRALLSRAVRGIHSDIAWRMQTEWAHDRFHKLLLQPSTVLTALFVPLVLVVPIWDGSRGALPFLRAVHAPASAVVRALAALLVAYGVVAAMRWLSLRLRGAGEGAASGRGRSRRSPVPREVVFFCFAVAVLGRYSVPPLDQIGAVGWAAFGGGLALNVAWALLGGLRRAARSARA